jgi:hypothetical protein
MKNNQSQPKNPKMSHFEELSIEILTKQNHNLFQTVNQLRHQLNQMSNESKEISDGISRAYVRRILQFLLSSVAISKSKGNQTPGQVSEKNKNHIMGIICNVLGPEGNSEKNIQNDIEGFVEGAHNLINHISSVRQLSNGENKIEDEGKFPSKFAL